MANKKAGGLWRRFLTSVWLFPAILLIIFAILVAFKISGSSVGVYHQALYGTSSRDPNLIYGKPRAIRSDEWLSATQIIVSQSKNGFPKFNKDLGSGRDISLNPAVPYKGWSTLFKPQNWAYFVLPLENAFAFQWWFLMFALIISCYFFVLRILPGNRLWAIFLSISLGLAPFELWWYQVASYLSIAYGFMALILLIRVLDGERIKFIKSHRVTYGIYALALAFIVACFGLVFYPPFQIPVAVVVLFFAVGYLIKKKLNDNLAYAQLAKRLAVLVAGLVAAGIVGVAYIADSHQAISSLDHTLYPGARTVSSGGLNFLKIFDTFMQPQLQSDSHGQHFLANQSEDSNFILLLPFLMIPGFVLMFYEYKNHRRIDWPFLLLQLCGLMFFARVFIPFGSVFYKIFLLQKVPLERMIIGFGFLGILQLAYLVKKIPQLKLSRKKLSIYALAYSALCLAGLLWIGEYTIKHYPLFINRRLEILGLSIVFTGIILFFLLGRKTIAVTLLLIFTLGSSFRIIPLYRGLGFDAHNAVTRKMEQVSGPNDSWGTVDIPLFQNAGLLAGRRSVTGTQIYPDLRYWLQVGGQPYQYVFNREAHAMLTTDTGFPGPVNLVERNFYEIKLSCDSQFIKNNVNFVDAIHPLSFSCLRAAGQVNYPQLTVYLYKVL